MLNLAGISDEPQEMGSGNDAGREKPDYRREPDSLKQDRRNQGQAEERYDLLQTFHTQCPLVRFIAVSEFPSAAVAQEAVMADLPMMAIHAAVAAAYTLVQKGIYERAEKGIHGITSLPGIILSSLADL
jgi:hypothetical protein